MFSAARLCASPVRGSWTQLRATRAATCAIPVRTFSSKGEWNLLFFGTDEFSLYTLKRLHKESGSGLVRNLEVVCPPSKKVGRGQNYQKLPVTQFCEENSITVHHPTTRLKDWKVPCLPSGELFDIGVVVSFGYFIPENVINSFKHTPINAHPSLLPKYRGSAPIHHTILNGDTKSGVSIIEIHPKKFDAGRILWQEGHPVRPDIMYRELHEELGNLSADAVVNTLAGYDSVNLIKQDPEAVSFARKIDREDCQVIWNQATAEDVGTMWRAFGDNYGIFTFLGNKRVKLFDVVPLEGEGGIPGKIRYDASRDMIIVQCAKGVVGCGRLQIENKPIRNALEFANGISLKKKDVAFDS